MKRSKYLLVVSVALNVLLIFKEFVFLPILPSKELTSDRGAPDKVPFDRNVQQILQETKDELSKLRPTEEPVSHNTSRIVQQNLEETKDNPSKLRPTEEPVWVYNNTATDIFRSQLEACCNGSQNLLVTQSNTPINTTIQYDAEGKSKLNVTTEIWRKFPQKTPFGYKKFPSCTVVGNSGLLKGSGCGKQIDSSDFVFRCNMAPIDERFVADVGNKANLVTINPSIVRDRYLGLKNTTLKERFVADLSRYGGAYVWMPAFSFKMCTSRSFGVQTTLQEYKSKLSVVFGNPQFMLAMNKYWKSNGVKARRISTGLFLASAALSICGEVHLYGFWPFHVDKHNVTLTEHYYDNALPHKMHKLPDEFAKLQQLHREGIIQLKTNSC